MLCRASTVVLAVFGASSGSSEDFQRVSEAYWGIRRVLGALQEVLREYELFFFFKIRKILLGILPIVSARIPEFQPNYSGVFFCVKSIMIFLELLSEGFLESLIESFVGFSRSSSHVLPKVIFLGFLTRFILRSPLDFLSGYIVYIVAKFLLEFLWGFLLKSFRDSSEFRDSLGTSPVDLPGGKSEF